MLQFSFKQKFLLNVIFIGLAFSFSGCGKGKLESPEATNTIRFQWNAVAPDTMAEIKVLNQFGEAIPGAQILIGSARGNPFQNNFIETDSSGVGKIPQEWTVPAHVTVDAAGYVRQTLLNQKPGNMIIKLGSSYLTQRAVLRGQVTQLPVVNGDKMIDFGLVMPALSRADILNFNLDQVISPYQDILSVANQDARLPSNVSLPTQKENYIFNFKIEKPIYRLMVPTLGPKTYFAATGRFPFKEVVNEIRAGKEFYELLNYFSITGGGLREAQIIAGQTNLDIPGTELQFKASVQVQSANVLADEVLLMLSVSDIGGNLIPTDVKRMQPNQAVTLTSMANKPAYIVSVIKKQAEFKNSSASDRISAALAPYKAGQTQSLLPLVGPPSITGTDAYVITLPPSPSTGGVNPIAVSATISDLFETQDGDSKITQSNHRWEIIGLGWGTRINLPAWPLANVSPKKKVEVNFIGSMTNRAVTLDDSLIEAATHVSHTSIEF